MSEQIAVRLPSEDLDSLDDLVSRGRYASRAEAVRSAVRALIDGERRSAMGNAIVDGYRRFPQTDEEVAATTEAAIRSIAEEPW